MIGDDTLSSDNLVQRPWGTKKVPGSGPQDSYYEEISAHHIGHTWGKVPDRPGGPTTYFVQDFLLDQSGKTGTDVAKLAETVQLDLTLTSTYEYWIDGGGSSVKVTTPQHAVGNVYFSAFLGRQATAGSTGGYFTPGTGTGIWFQGTGTAGTIPTVNPSFSITQSNNSAFIFEVEAEVTAENWQFGALRLQGEYPPRSFDPGQELYYPLSYAVPFGVGELPPGMRTDGETFILFGYTYEPSTTTPTDPGPFVSLVLG